MFSGKAESLQNFGSFLADQRVLLDQWALCKAV